MKSSTALACLALVVLPVLAGCTSTKELVSSVVGPAPKSDEPLPEAAGLDRARTRKLYLLVVERLRQQGSARAALSYLDEYDRQYPGDAEARLMRADCLVSIGDVAQAEPIYTQLQATKFKPAAAAGLGKVAAGRADWSGAVKNFQDAVSLSPSTPDYISNLAYAQMRAGQYDAALSSMRQAQELDPGNTIVRNNTILCLQLSGRGAEAQAMLRGIADEGDRRAVQAMLRSYASANVQAQLMQN